MKWRQDVFPQGLSVQIDQSELSDQQLAATGGCTINNASAKLAHRGGAKDIKATTNHPIAAAFWSPGNNLRYIVWAEDTGGYYYIYRYDIDSGVTTTIANNVSGQFVSFGSSKRYTFQLVPYDRYVFFVANDSLNCVHAAGTGPNEFFTFGASNLPVAGFAAGAAGNPNGTYEYVATYYFEYFDVETNCFELVAGTTPGTFTVAGFQVNMTVNTANYGNSGVYASKCRIYRRRNTDTYFKYIGEFTPTGGVDAFVDNVANGSEGVQIPYDHDAYGGLDSTNLVVHNSRLWVSGESLLPGTATVVHQNRLWFSALSSPFYFARTVVTQTDALAPDEYRYPNDADAGGYLELDNSASDYILDMESYGSFLALGRQKTHYLLQGDDWTTGFVANKIADVGTTGPRSMVNAGGRVFTYGSDLKVYELQNQVLTNIGRPIQTGLLVNPNARTDARTACWGYYDDKAFFSITTENLVSLGTENICYVLNVAGGWWEQWTGAPMYVRQFIQRSGIYEGTNLSNVDPFLITTANNYSTEAGVTYTGVRSILTTDTTRQAINVTSGRLDMGQPEEQKRIRRVKVWGINTPQSGSLTLTLTAYNRDQTFVADYTCATSATMAILLETDTCAGLVGEQFTWNLAGTCNAFLLGYIELEYDVLGRRVY
jgi:hypothetical protein